MKKALSLLSIVMLLAGSAPGLFAQDTSAAFVGVILDPSGKPASGFKVVLKDKVEEPDKPKPEPAKPNAKSGQPKPIAVRANFNPLAAFAPATLTGADGTADIAVTMPDNLTRYRIVALLEIVSPPWVMVRRRRSSLRCGTIGSSLRPTSQIVIEPVTIAIILLRIKHHRAMT
jgi:hypothetical protein